MSKEQLEAAGWTVQLSQEMDGHPFEVWYLERGEDHQTYVRSDDADAIARLVAEPTFDEPMTRMPDGWTPTADLPPDVQAELGDTPSAGATRMEATDA